MIALSEPNISGNEWKYIKECLDTGWVSSVGSYVVKFEEMVSRYVGVKYAVATVNGTSALHVALVACGVCHGDEVIVPTLTFIASANTVKYCGADPVFMDCDSQTLCIDTEKVITFIRNNTLQKKDGFTYNKDTGRRIKAIMPVHIFGHPTDMGSIIDICDKHNIYIIEDAAESLGAEYKRKKVGSLGNVGCLSFNGNKIITAGGGGMVVTDNKKLADRIRHLTTQAKVNSLEYDHDEVGYNYRLSNIQAALGCAQMERLAEYIKIKRKNANFYKYLLSSINDVDFLWEKDWAKSIFWFCTIKAAKKEKKSLIKYLLSKEIQVRSIWKLIHRLPMYKDCQAYNIEQALEAFDTCINIPCSVNLSKGAIKFVVNVVKGYFKTK